MEQLHLFFAHPEVRSLCALRGYYFTLGQRERIPMINAMLDTDATLSAYSKEFTLQHLTGSSDASCGEYVNTLKDIGDNGEP